jgi:hypothetical protein
VGEAWEREGRGSRLLGLGNLASLAPRVRRYSLAGEQDGSRGRSREKVQSSFWKSCERS